MIKPMIMFVAIAILCLLTTTAHSFPSAPVLQTGQIICYDAVGSAIDCTGTGQDGEVQNGFQWSAARFLVNGDQTVTDKLTGLIWTQYGNPAATRTWQQALDYIKTLNSSNYLGHNDWRLPNLNELRSMVNKGQPNTGSWLNAQGFSNVGGGWSSSTYAGYPAGAWIVKMGGGGYEYVIDKTYSSYVWPVRAGQSVTSGYLTLPKTGQSLCYDISGNTIGCSGTGQDGEQQIGTDWPSSRFYDNGDQTFTDNLTGLMWSKNADPASSTVTWQEALDYIQSLNSSNYLGYCDWQLPNANELGSLANKGKAITAVWLNTQGFTNVQAANYWSSSTYAYDPINAWVVTMAGYSPINYKLNGNYVWPVRAGQHWVFAPLVISTSPKFRTLYSIAPAAPHQVEIANRGNSSQSVSSISVTGTNASEFSINTGGTNPCSTLSPTLAVDSSCTLMLVFSPTSSGAKSASLDITANSTTNSIALSGTAITTIYGTVTDLATGLTVSGATVTLNTSATATTTGGNYFFGNLPAATYSISVAKNGYQSTSKSGLVVSSTTSVKADIFLPTVGTLNITSTTLPWASPNVPYSSRVMVAGGTVPYTFSRPYGALPPGLTLDTSTGTISGTPTGTGSYTFAIGVTDTIAGYSEREFTIELLPPLQITTASLPSGQQGVAYSRNISGNGGKPAYSFTLVSGTLPNGLALGSSGTVSGTPRESGSFNINVRLTDSTRVTVDKSYTLILTAADAFIFNTTTLAEGAIGTYYSFALSASGGVDPRTFSVAETLPTELTLNISSGVISGTPSAAGLTNLTFSVTDYSYPTAQTASRVIPLRIWTPVNGSCGSCNSATLTSAPSVNLCTSGTESTVTGSGPWNWNCSGLHSGATASCSANIQSYSITFASGGNGTLTGNTSQTVNHGSNTTAVTAVPAAGYHLANWTGTGGFITTSANPLTISNATSAMAITANFAANPVNGSCGSSNGVTLTTAPTTNLCSTGTVSAVTGNGPWSWSCSGANGGTSASCSASISIYSVTFASGGNGSLTGTTSQIVNAGSNTTTITAVPNSGYHFVNWTGTNGFVTTSANPLTISNVTATMAITANFSADPVNGTCGSSNGATLTDTTSANLCSTGSVSVVTGTGPWNWSCSGLNGGATANCSANIQTYSITFASGGNGTLTGSTSQSVNHGSNTTVVTAVPTTGYHFTNWTGTGGFVTTSANPLTISNVTSAMAITANFIADPGNGNCGSSNGVTVTTAPTTNLCSTGTASAITGNWPWSWSCSGLNGGITVSCSANIQTYSVTFASSGNGTMTGNTSQTINHGSNTTAVTAVPAKGYHFTNWTGTGGFVSTSTSPLTINNVTATMAITANFAADPVNGACGSSNGGTFTAAPTLTLCNSGTASTVTGSGPWAWTCAGSNGGSPASCTASIQAYAVTFSAGSNGSITGSTSQTVNHGGSSSPVTAVPAAGFTFINWTGTNGFAATTANPVTLGSVAGSTAITANFADTTAPTITAFSVPTSSNTLNVPISAFTANDLGSGVAIYCVSEANSSTGCVWTSNKPTSFTVSSAGSVNLYAWVRDTAGNIGGLGKPATVIITLARGDLNGSGLVDIADTLKVLRHVMLGGILSAPELGRADIAPLGAPDNNIDINDVIMMLRIAVAN